VTTIDNSLLLKLLQQHQSWYPFMQERDAYKLIYQATMGPEHLIPNQQDFTRELEVEFSQLVPDPDERLLEAVRPDQTLFRLNLRPYKSGNQAIDRLVPFFIETPKHVTASLYDLVKSWRLFVDFCERGQLRSFRVRRVQHFTIWVEKEGYPAIHHSPVYREHYQPHYRLISAKSLGELGLFNAS
jgi:hypothetical protein